MKRAYGSSWHQYSRAWNRYGDKALLELRSVINVELTPAEARDLSLEIQSWEDLFGNIDDVGKFLEALGLGAEVLTAMGRAVPEIGLPGGILLFMAGVAIDWTTDDLDAIQYAVDQALVARPNENVALSLNSYLGGWNVQVNNEAVVEHLSIHPLLTPKGQWNATPLWLLMWYTCDYGQLYGEHCTLNKQ